MEKFLKAFFENEKIEYYASEKIRRETVVSPRRLPTWAEYVTVFLIPYNISLCEKRNVSRYAVSRDYHFYIKLLSEKLSEKTEYAVPFSDTSPFDERRLAKELRLGFLGENGLLINEKYGSYVFIGEIVTKDPVDISQGVLCQKDGCLSCGACKKHCPSGFLCGNGTECLSFVTQKKKVSEEDEKSISEHSLVWGCDVCSEVCPHNKNAADTPIDFFKNNRVAYLSSQILSQMGEEEFLLRAYSWRGKNVISRNLFLQNL